MTEYTRGFSAGYQRAAVQANQAHTGEIQRLKFHFAWSLLHLEQCDRSPTIAAHITWLRSAYQIDLVGGGVEQYIPDLTTKT